MIRHIFIGTFKEGISDEIKQKELADMKVMKECQRRHAVARNRRRIPGIPQIGAKQLLNIRFVLYY